VFGGPAVLAVLALDPWLCVPVFQRVCPFAPYCYPILRGNFKINLLKIFKKNNVNFRQDKQDVYPNQIQANNMPLSCMRRVQNLSIFDGF
jgi:hypothetical protein